jgi:hypothetical protein
MEIYLVSETLVLNLTLTRVITGENFITFTRREKFQILNITHNKYIAYIVL